MLLSRDDNRSLWFISGLILLSRIPFLFAGYGSEEDAWGLILTARNISLTGIYEVSRMPGHPLQEYLLSLLWIQPAWILNLLTAVVSSLGVYFFMASLRHLKIPNAVPAGLALAFTPVVYMHSTNVMDYTWSLALMMLALYLTITGRYYVAAVVIGLAAGFRITAAAIALPLALWHFINYRSIKMVVISGLITLVTALICFIPAFRMYGAEFFTYYEYFPYPPLLKNIYKGTVGAWGVVGSIAVAAATIAAIKNYRITIQHEKWRGLKWLCVSALILFSFSFIKIPQKTAFVIPLVPFVIFLLAMLLAQRQMILLAASFVFSCFFIGINLDDPLRGSKASGAAFRFTAGNTPITLDLLCGIVPADYSKRQLKMDYAHNVVQQMEHVNEKTIVISGWWQNELNFFSLKNPNPKVSYLYYADEKQVRDSIEAGYRIYFLPEQDYWNDLRWRQTFTQSIAQPLRVN